MVFVIQNVEDFKGAIKSCINNTNDLSSQEMQNSVTTFLDRTGLVNEAVAILKDELLCAVCHDIPLETCLTECKHMFCTHCLNMCALEKLQCPMCRAVFEEEIQEHIQNDKIDTIIDVVMSKHNSKYELWKKQENERRFCEYYSTIIQRSLNRVAQRLECLKSHSDHNTKILKQDLSTFASKLLFLLEELPCPEPYMGNFQSMFDEVFAELSLLN